MPITLEVVEPDEDGRENFAIRGGAMGPALPDLDVVYPEGACMGAALPGLDIIRILVTTRFCVKAGTGRGPAVL